MEKNFHRVRGEDNVAETTVWNAGGARASAATRQLCDTRTPPCKKVVLDGNEIAHCSGRPVTCELSHTPRGLGSVRRVCECFFNQNVYARAACVKFYTARFACMPYLFPRSTLLPSRFTLFLHFSTCHVLSQCSLIFSPHEKNNHGMRLSPRLFVTRTYRFPAFPFQISVPSRAVNNCASQTLSPFK